MTKWLHKFTWVAGLSLLACGGAAGDGCSTEVLPNGFPQNQTVANAANLRLNRSGLNFLESVMPRVLKEIAKAKPDGTLEFPFDTSTAASFGVLGFDFVPTICPDGTTAASCTAVMDIAKSVTQLDARVPHALSLNLTVPVMLRDTPIKLSNSRLGNIVVHVAYGDNTSCDRETPSATPHALPLPITVPMMEGTAAPRTGYTYADIDNAKVNVDGLSSDNVKICADCGSLASWACNGILNSGLIKGNIVKNLRNQIDGAAKGAMRSALCTAPVASKSGVPTCPAGSKPNPEGTQCVYNNAADKCVPRQLGVDGSVDVGSLLGGIAPGTSGLVDYLFAAGGDMDPWPKVVMPNETDRTPNGMTFHVMGGALESEKSRCVEPVALTRPTGIPLPDELKAETIGAWPLPEGPHLGFALSERFLNYGLASAYNSGVLCLKLNSDTLPQLNSSTLAILAGSIKTLSAQGQPAALSLLTHPSTPPTATIGSGANLTTDPLLRINMKRFGIDVMVWSHDRYLRAFTYTADISIPINLEVDPSKPEEAILLPKIGAVLLENASVTNSEALLEKPETIASGLTGVIGTLVSSAASKAAQKVPLNGALAAYGVGFAMPQGAIRKLTKDNDRFLGIFTNFTDTSKKKMATTLERGQRVVSLPSFGCQTSPVNTQAPVSSCLAAAAVALAVLGFARRRTLTVRHLKWAAFFAAASLPNCDCNDNNADAGPPKCGEDCSRVCEGTVDRGLVGAYGSAALGPDGKVYTAGYADALFPSSGNGIQPYGDLAVGTLDTKTGATQWDVIDGLPARTAGTCSPMDPRGWRKGETDPGDNVGLWTSTVVSSGGVQHVAYYDATHGALKYALHQPGQPWSVHVVAQAEGSDIGRYASLSLRGGKPVIAFHRLASGPQGASHAALLFAEAKTDLPRGTSDWTIETVAELKTAACSALRVGDGSSTCGTLACVKDTGICTAAVAGCASCGATEVCTRNADNKPTCTAAVTRGTMETIPKRFGIYSHIVVSEQNTAVAAFDAWSRKLTVYRRSGAQWLATQVDGAGIAGGSTSAGAGVAGAFDSAGALHVSYIDQAKGTLRYAKVGAAPETVDDGSSPTGTPFVDRLHEISPDTAIRVDSNNTVSIAYQDGTAGRLRFAVRRGQTWTKTISGESGRISGSFPDFLRDGRVVNFSRAIDKSTNEASGDLRLQSAP